MNKNQIARFSFQGEMISDAPFAVMEILEFARVLVVQAEEQDGNINYVGISPNFKEVHGEIPFVWFEVAIAETGELVNVNVCYKRPTTGVGK